MQYTIHQKVDFLVSAYLANHSVRMLSATEPSTVTLYFIKSKGNISTVIYLPDHKQFVPVVLSPLAELRAELMTRQEQSIWEMSVQRPDALAWYNQQELLLRTYADSTIANVSSLRHTMQLPIEHVSTLARLVHKITPADVVRTAKEVSGVSTLSGLLTPYKGRCLMWTTTTSKGLLSYMLLPEGVSTSENSRIVPAENFSRLPPDVIAFCTEETESVIVIDLGVEALRTVCVRKGCSPLLVEQLTHYCLEKWVTHQFTIRTGNPNYLTDTTVQDLRCNEDYKTNPNGLTCQISLQFTSMEGKSADVGTFVVSLGTTYAPIVLPVERIIYLESALMHSNNVHRSGSRKPNPTFEITEPFTRIYFLEE